ncbi:MAG TPA: 50S ribosomal protein L11 methyltransferase [Pseudolabrys sp.]|nr:50S ribosomal protein L11 methyltransferase [Pseudolabrys sp.]
MTSTLTPASHRANFAIGSEITAKHVVDRLTESFFEGQAAVAAFERPDGLWNITVNFADPPDQASIRELVGLAAGDDIARHVTFDTVEAKDWVKASLEDLVPVPAGRFIVHGQHDRDRVPSNKLGIEIEAALAFGTGHHGTTRGCLLALDALVKRRRSRRVLDLGTGSGVLAIAAAKILRTRVIASDIDRVAIEAARGNARLNRAGTITFARAAGTKASAIASGAPYDLILANILLGPLMRLSGPLRRLAARHARVVLSGLLPGHANAAIAIYRAQGFALERRVPLDGWVTLILRR